MDIASILQKPGREWSDAERDAVYRWLKESGEIDGFVRFVFGRIKNLDWAIEVVAKVLAYLFGEKKYQTYDPARYHGKKCPFRNWLFFILSRAAARKVRQEIRRRQREQQKEQQREEQNPQSSSEPFLNLDLKRLLAQLLPLVPHVVESLSQTYREALDLFYGKLLSIKEAAKRLGCSIGAFKVRLCRARQELYKLLCVSLTPEAVQELLRTLQEGTEPMEGDHHAS
jgi:RNA polymerase sigma factor (sigma-70 family)